jgi:hypothetical protein
MNTCVISEQLSKPEVQPAILERVFSHGVIRELSRFGASPILTDVLRESGLGNCLDPDTDLRSTFEFAFTHIACKDARSDYVFRAAVVQNVLLGEHDLASASIVSEMNVGTARADLVVFNGTSTVYEIKSERDSLSRLEGQLTNYQKVFGRIYLITGDRHIDRLLNFLPEEIGIKSVNRDGMMIPVRTATDQSKNVDVATIFDTLRFKEIVDIMSNFGFESVTELTACSREDLREGFVKLPPSAVHAEMVKVLRRSRSALPISTLIEMAPASARALCLSIKLTKRERERLMHCFSLRLRDVLV